MLQQQWRRRQSRAAQAAGEQTRAKHDQELHSAVMLQLIPEVSLQRCLQREGTAKKWVRDDPSP